MADESKTFKIIGSVIGLLAAGSGIVALLTYFSPSKPSPNSSNIVVVATPVPHQNTNSPVRENSSSPVPVKVECKIAGEIYNEDDSNKPMGNVQILLIDDKNNQTPVVRSKPDGIFAGNCSQMPQHAFPQKLKFITSSGLSWIAQDYPIPAGGRDDLVIYLSENKIRNNLLKAVTIRKAQTISPALREAIRTANKQ